MAVRGPSVPAMLLPQLPLDEASQHHGFLIGNPIRTGAEEEEMVRLQEHLADHGEDRGWKTIAGRAALAVQARATPGRPAASR